MFHVWLLAVTASAEPGGFHLPGRTPVRVDEIALPRVAAEAIPADGVGFCVVRFAVGADGAATAEVPWCHGALADVVGDAASRWRFAARAPDAPTAHKAVAFYAFAGAGTPEPAVTWALPVEEGAPAEVLPDGVVYLVRPTVLRRHVPAYPNAARKAGAGDATCALLVVLDRAGTPEDVVIESCPAPFVKAATKAAGRFRFDPPRLDGLPVPGLYALEFRFLE